MKRSLAAVCLITSSVLAQTIYVDQAASTGGNGKSWATAYRSLQSGLKAATKGTRVFVARGTYAGGFVVPDGVSVLGGFDAGQVRPTQRTRFGSTLDGKGNRGVVVMGADTLLDGFVVTRGRGGSLGGGGALVDGVVAVIRNCMFTFNTSGSGRGAAIHARRNARLRLENSIFYKNAGPGHVIDFTVAAGTVDHIVVWDNIENGLHFHLGTSIKITNSIFGKNTGRGVCHISPNDRPVVENNLFFNNRVALYHVVGKDLRDIRDVNKLAYAKNNLSADPRFVGSTRADFRLRAASPCVDTGTLVSAGVDDPARNGRLLDGNRDGRMVTDIGCYEYAPARLAVRGSIAKRVVDVRLDAPGGVAVALLIAARPAAALIDPWGHLRVDITSGLIVVPWTSGTNVAVPVPATVKAGTSLAWQGLGVAATNGTFTNLVDLYLK